MHLLVKLLAIALIVPTFFLFWLGFRLLRTPREAFESHQRLVQAVRAVNRGTSTKEQLAVVKNAEKMGLVEGIPTFAGYRSWHLYYRRTQLSDDLFWSGQSQNTDHIDEELAGYEARPSNS